MATRLLCNRSIPLRLKIWFVRNALNPIASYGAQIWGTRATTARKLQSRVNVGLRMALRVGRTTAVSSMLFLARVKPIEVLARNLVLGAAVRWSNTSVYITELLSSTHVVRQRPMTVLRNLKRAVRRTVGSDNEVRGEQLDALRASLLRDWFCRAWQRSRLSDALWREGRITSNMLFDAFERLPDHFLELGNVVRLICQSWRGAPLDYFAGRIPEEYRRRCPFCNHPGPEDVVHYLLHCPAWAEPRRTFLEPLLAGTQPHRRVLPRMDAILEADLERVWIVTGTISTTEMP